MTYKRKTPTIEAVQYDGTNESEIRALLENAEDQYETEKWERSEYLTIFKYSGRTPEYDHYASVYPDWQVAVTDEGEVLVMVPDDLERLYEVAE